MISLSGGVSVSTAGPENTVSLGVVYLLPPPLVSFVAKVIFASLPSDQVQSGPSPL